MNRAFYSLPDPREVGLKWKEFGKAAAKVGRIEKRFHDTQNERARLEQEIRELGENEVRQLAGAILEGTDDPTASASSGEHEKLVERVRLLKREEQAIAQALPVAEEELRQTVFEHQSRWKEEADSALEKALEAERRAYLKVLDIIEDPRSKRLYAENLAAWVRNVGPTFGTPEDAAGRSAIGRLQADAEYAADKHNERQENERLARQQEEGVAS